MKADKPIFVSGDAEDLSVHLADDGYKRWYQRRAFWVWSLCVLLLILFVPWIPLLYTGGIEVKRLDAKGESIMTEVGPRTKQWVSVKSVSRHLLHAIVVAEDAKFYQHHGFDFEAIRKAYALNQRKGKFMRGGSTISQQVVKMAFLSREKTYLRKAREAVGTVLMELLLPKDKILEWYINLTEFGGGIYGVKQAGHYYFKTRPELLTTEQSIHLALVIPSPNKWSKGLRAKSLTPFGHRRFSRIVSNLSKAGYISDTERQTALARGNFGAPIAGSRAALALNTAEDLDDCKGDKECDDDDIPKPIKSEKPAGSDLEIHMLTSGEKTPLPENDPGQVQSSPSNVPSVAPSVVPTATPTPGATAKGMPPL